MQHYQHYSFDLWLTLIRSNPQFKEQRALYFYDSYNFHYKTLDEVKLIFRQVDLMANAINEKTGKNIDADELYLMVISMMNDYDILAHDIDLPALEEQMEHLLFTYMPMLYSDTTSSVLRALKQETGSSFSILSNTGFIRGATLRKVLAKLGIAELFGFQLYSDEEGMSKPNGQLFELMLQYIADLKKGNNPVLQQIIHVGDNPRADVGGATAAGIGSLLINSNQQPISILLS